MGEQIFIVLFRGVGGETKLPVKPLREALTKAGFRHVTTYIATGNVILASHLRAEAVKVRVAKVAKSKLGFSKEIIVLTRNEWSGVVKHNPFKRVMSEPRTLHVFALQAKPSKEVEEALTARVAAPDGVAVRGRAIYLHTPDGFGKSKLPAIIERTLKAPMTARNWNTVLKLNELAAKATSKPAGK